MFKWLCLKCLLTWLLWNDHILSCDIGKGKHLSNCLQVFSMVSGYWSFKPLRHFLVFNIQKSVCWNSPFPTWNAGKFFVLRWQHIIRMAKLRCGSCPPDDSATIALNHRLSHFHSSNKYFGMSAKYLKEQEGLFVISELQRCLLLLHVYSTFILHWNNREWLENIESIL